MPKPKAIHCPEDLDAVHAVLKRKLRAAGRGAVTETEKALGLYRGYLRYHRHRQELDLGALLAMLKRLEISPLEFFAKVAAERGEAPAGNPPEPGAPPADSEPGPVDVTAPGAPPDVEPLTARAVLRQLGADLPVYGDFDP